MVILNINWRFWWISLKQVARFEHFFPNKVQLIINWTFNCPEWILALRNRFKNPFMTLRRSNVDLINICKKWRKNKVGRRRRRRFRNFHRKSFAPSPEIKAFTNVIDLSSLRKVFFFSLSLLLSHTHTPTLAQTNTKSYARTSTCWIKLSHTRTQTSLFILALWLLFGWFPFK